MSRFLRASLMLLFLASCGGRGDFAAPRNLDDACAIMRERPQYMRAMVATERRWGIPVHVQMATIYQESKFIGNARTPYSFVLGVIPMGRQSTAYGYSQALNGTWEEYQASAGGRRAKRDDIGDATDFMGWYMDESSRKAGHFQGRRRSTVSGLSRGSDRLCQRKLSGQALAGRSCRQGRRAVRDVPRSAGLLPIGRGVSSRAFRSRR